VRGTTKIIASEGKILKSPLKGGRRLGDRGDHQRVNGQLRKESTALLLGESSLTQGLLRGNTEEERYGQ